MTDNWVRYIPTGGGEFVEAGPFIGPDQQEAVRLQKIEALRAEARDAERQQQAELAELIHEIGYIADDGDLENARALAATVPRLSLPPALGAQITAALEAFARASEQLAEAQAALVKATTPPLRVGELRINLKVDQDALIRAREMVERLNVLGFSPQAAAILKAFGRPDTVQLLDNAGVSVASATLDQVARMPGFFPFLRDALASAVDPVATAQRVLDSYASVNEELVRLSCIHVGPEGMRSSSGFIIRTATGDISYRNELTFEGDGMEITYYPPFPPSDTFSVENTPPPELVVEPHEQAIAAPPSPPDGDTARHLSLMQAIDARLEAARASGRRVNVLEVGAVEAALLGQTTGYNHMLSDGQVVGLTVRRIDRDAALSVYYDPEA